MNKRIYILLLTVGLTPLACTMSPRYSRPTPSSPDVWPRGSAYATQTNAGVNSAFWTNCNWQICFTDTKLQKLISTALTNNMDMRLAVLNVENARAQYGIQRAELLPSLDGAAGVSRARVPHDLTTSGKAMTQSTYSVNLGAASWEIDFFGRIRSLKESALQHYLGTEQAQRNARIILVSSVVNGYIALAADVESLKLAETTFDSQSNTLNLITRRHQLGMVSDLDVKQATMQVEAARGEIARLRRQVAQDKNALQLLIGTAVPEEFLPVNLSSVASFQEPMAGLPSDVLLRRPDVVQAEDELKASNANIGAARAAFFPRISLTAAIGTASSDLSGLFKSGSLTWNYAPQLVVPVFDARTWSAHKMAKVQHEMAIAQYQRAIQNAFREVADALATRGTVGDELASQESLVKAVSEAYQISSARYNKGLDSYLSVLDAQRALYTAQKGLVMLRMAKMSSSVRMYAVLGGDSPILSSERPARQEAVR